MEIKNVDICCGLAWGDEAKGKLVSYLSRTQDYDFVCRWAGGSNAGHTIYKEGKRYKTHLIPSGIFYGITSIIGPGCVINKEDFEKEISYLKENGFDTSLVKISPKTHVIQDSHIKEDKQKYKDTQGSTSKGIAPCYRDKYARIGSRVGDKDNIQFFYNYIWDEKLYGNILCEGAQGVWLDIDYGNYPYVTSSSTLPYAACSLGFSPKLINNIYGAVKIYDTRSGIDPDFPESLLEDKELLKIIDIGKEYGTTTGRKRKANWLDLDKLVKSINISGTTIVIISKIDVLITINLFKLFFNKQLVEFKSLTLMKEYIKNVLKSNCNIDKIIYSGNVETIDLK